MHENVGCVSWEQEKAVSLASALLLLAPLPLHPKTRPKRKKYFQDPTSASATTG